MLAKDYTDLGAGLAFVGWSERIEFLATVFEY
jgi:hypothetical protein